VFENLKKTGQGRLECSIRNSTKEVTEILHFKAVNKFLLYCCFLNTFWFNTDIFQENT